MIDWLSALILGIVQGASEYLPISSSGHLEIFRSLLGIDLPAEQSLEFDIMVHAATVLSTIVILAPMFKRLCDSFFAFRRDEDFYYVCKVLVSCIPVGIVGVFLKDSLENLIDGGGLLLVGICLCVTALLLAFAYFSGIDRRTGRPVPADKGRNITWGDAITIGMAQAVAVLPGLSRSGTTIATGIILGDKRSRVAEFSFIMVILPIVGEALLDLAKMLRHAPAAGGGNEAVGATAMIIGFVAAFLVGIVCCRWMIGLVKKGKLIWFAVYCLAMGVTCILLR